MTSQIMDDLLCLLMAVIVADKRVFAQEVQAFLTEAAKLQVKFEIMPQWSEAKFLMWYELNKATVKQQALGPNLESWLYERVGRLAVIDDKPAILEAMRQVALADGEIRVSEQALIVLTARQWVLHPLGER
jgi:uncharacterized tellurite resistance protein B-like protein